MSSPTNTPQKVSDSRLEFIRVGSLPGWTWQNIPTQNEVHSMAIELIQARKALEGL
jgi:hypothetical protein